MRLLQEFPPKISTASAQHGSGLADLCATAEPYVAVHDLCLAMEYGECFGLLGPNGSGKTTTINILAGNATATSGSAHVGGFDVETEMHNVHQVLGCCPQFDCVSAS